ncbi:MAG: transglycosylase SLT domain-containing protein [Candidatus Paceibacterota bacterium]|jgi:hypothetical protein
MLILFSSVRNAKRFFIRPYLCGIVRVALIDQRFLSSAEILSGRRLMMKVLLIGIVVCCIAFQLVMLMEKIAPVQSVSHDEIKFSSTTIPKPSQKILSSVNMASSLTGLSNRFLVALMFSESSFNQRAVSSKSYHGLMQIRWPIYDPDVNVLSGAKTFVDKLKQTDGDYLKAICLYKGWPESSREGQQQARKVMILARTIQM